MIWWRIYEAWWHIWWRHDVYDDWWRICNDIYMMSWHILWYNVYDDVMTCIWWHHDVYIMTSWHDDITTCMWCCHDVYMMTSWRIYDDVMTCIWWRHGVYIYDVLQERSRRREWSCHEDRVCTGRCYRDWRRKEFAVWGSQTCLPTDSRRSNHVIILTVLLSLSFLVTIEQTTVEDSHHPYVHCCYGNLTWGSYSNATFPQ